MERKIIQTSDGSSSVYLPQWDENYHSKHGAIQEAYHVFIKSGLDLFKDGSKLGILEMGFGTGLNCMITYLEAKKRNLTIVYQSIQTSDWDVRVKMHPQFDLTKREIMFEDYQGKEVVDLIYFDAFGARVQPELWTETIFKKMYEALKIDGIIVTYAAKGSVRRAMQAVGFKVERLPGPPGKREMLRGIKSLTTE
jgi:tRNA U34 5-methylaminomethyl-2-thiouridine-forming methyltransferase MnmC